LRALPEFLSGIYPVGFDTLQGYAPAVLALPDISPMKLFGWVYSPLAVLILWFVRFLTGVDIYFLLKIAGPVFYGLLSCSFYFLLTRGLGWSNKKSFFITLILVLQPAILRMGWDQFREELGLCFLFVLLAITKGNLVPRDGIKLKVFCILPLSLLIVFSHQLIALLFFVAFFWQLFIYESKRDRLFFGSVFVIIPSVIFFVLQINGQFLNPSFSNHFGPLILPGGTGNFVFTDYFQSDPIFLGGNYLTILSYVGGLALYSVVPLIPFAVKGFFKDKVFLPIIVWLSVMSFSILVFPWYAFSLYWWWVLLLPIPLTFYLGEFLSKNQVFEGKALPKHKRMFYGAVLLMVLLASSYASSTVQVIYSNTTNYIPAGMVESSISFGDIPDVHAAIAWVNNNVPVNSTVIVQEAIQGFSYTELRSDIQIRVSSSLLTLDKASHLIIPRSVILYAIWYGNKVDNTTLNGLVSTVFGKIGVIQFNS
jgi:hypothetical protein